jgi:hypothetical protein
MVGWGDVSTEPDLACLLYTPGGEMMLDVEYRFGRENTEGKPELVSLYSGGVVGSDW